MQDHVWSEQLPTLNMFSDESNCEEHGAKTIQDCYDWAMNPLNINKVRELRIKHQGRNLPVIQCLRYAIIRSNAIVEMHSEKVKNRFQGGILHKNNYRCESHWSDKF